MAVYFPGPCAVQSKPPELETLQQLVIVGEYGSDSVSFRDVEGVSVQESTGLIYASDSHNHRIQIFTETGVIVNHFGGEHLRQPWGLLIHEYCALVSDWTHHTIFIFALSDFSMLNRIGNKGCGYNQFNCPSQLAISPNKEVYVADCFNDRVQILDRHLHFRGAIQHETMTRPVDLKFSNNQMLVLSAIDNPCIHIFTLSGEKIRSIISRGVGMQVKLAYFFCPYGNNKIMISDSSGHDIKIFSHEGDLLQIIGECGFEPGMFHFPRGIAVLRDTKLICASNNFSVQIFSIN